MKHLLLISIVALSILSCRKDLQPSDSDYLATVTKALKDSLSSSDFSALDFTKAARSRVDSVDFYALRVPFKEKAPQEDFVFVKTNAKGQIEKGKIVHLKGNVSDEGNGTIKRKRWDGTISLTSLNRAEIFQSPIINGYVTAYHQSSNFRTSTQVVEGLMPEVVITYTISSGNDFSWSSWFYLQSFFSNGESGGGGNYYGSFIGGSNGGDPSTGGGGSGGGSTGTGSNDPVILVDMETQDTKDAIDLQKYINCFGSVPDAGATCSIEIFSDIPVDSNPNAFYDFSTMSPGHSFINIQKSNGTQHITQNIGFYPKSGYKSMTYAPTASKLVDNAGHEFNASLRMDITPAQLSTVLIRMQQWANANYDVDQYNCTDWALNVFNSVRTTPLEIPLYGIPDSPITLGSRTPQGLYNKLQQMKNSNDPEKANITIGIYKGYAGGSTGPCN